MKPYFPIRILQALTAACLLISMVGVPHSFATDNTYQNGTASFGGQTGNHMWTDYEEISFSGFSSNGSSNGLFHSDPHGGAFRNATVILKNNGTVNISNSYTGYFQDYFSPSYSEFYSYGGAIYNSSFQIENNENVNIQNNHTSTFSSSYPYYSFNYAGGAIYNKNSSNQFVISGNDNVSIQKNRVYSSSSVGGAIYNSGTFSVSGNGNVEFRQNWEQKGNLLRSIVSNGTLSLSAPEEHRITFFDSIYSSGVLKLNETGAGDIIFTGATTEADLLVMKGSAGTATEITNSRTSYIGGATLYDGRLVVEDKAACQFSWIDVENEASIILKEATLQHSSGSMIVTQAQNAEKAELKGASVYSNSLYGEDAEHIGFISGATMSISNTATMSVKYVTLDAMTGFNSAATALAMTDVTAQMAKGVNSTLVGEDTVLSDTMLVRSGNGAETLTMAAGTTVLQLENSAFDAKSLQGDTLHLILSGYTMEEIQARDYLVISFKNSAAYASLDKDLAVSLQVDGVEGAVTITGWYLASDIQNGGKATALYFETAKMPEPATAALSILALAALATRRKRK